MHLATSFLTYRDAPSCGPQCPTFPSPVIYPPLQGLGLHEAKLGRWGDGRAVQLQGTDWVCRMMVTTSLSWVPPQACLGPQSVSLLSLGYGGSVYLREPGCSHLWAPWPLRATILFLSQDL